jgi:DNA-binding XRE family transcriptional regulator
MRLNEHIKEKMNPPEFRKIYEEEKHLLELGLTISGKRKALGLSQKELAGQCHVTRQQVSKIENGVNCNLLTFIKITSKLG